MIPLYYNYRSLFARRLSTGATVVGLALVVFVFAAVLMHSRLWSFNCRAFGKMTIKTKRSER